jgi:uncharacterized membrane protein
MAEGDDGSRADRGVDADVRAGDPVSTPNAPRLNRIIGLVLRVGVTTSSVCLALGLLLLLAGAPGSPLLLQVGLVVLLATPVARVIVSIVEYAVERDWTFTALTLIVLAELTASLVAALYGRKL